MLPWETLRRLLGLPADMQPPGAAELVRLAIDDPRRARLIGMALSGQTPKEAPAGMLVAAHEAGKLAPELVAELLGAVGHRSGYRTVRDMLFDEGVGTAGAPAGVAMARILGREAIGDLSLALRMAPTREGREGGALGLAELEDEEASASVAEAGADGRIRARVVARCVARMPFDPDEWLRRLASGRTEDRRLATEVIWVLVEKGDAESHARLAALGPEGREGVRQALEDPDVYMLPEKRDALLAWLRG